MFHNLSDAELTALVRTLMRGVATLTYKCNTLADYDTLAEIFEVRQDAKSDLETRRFVAMANGLTVRRQYSL